MLDKLISPKKPNLAEIFIACAIGLAAPKTLDNLVPCPLTDWMEADASILQVIASPEIETPEEVAEATIYNLGLIGLSYSATLWGSLLLTNALNVAEGRWTYKSRSKEENQHYAAHEAAHALLAALSKYMTVEKATIIPHGDSGGHVLPAIHGYGDETTKGRMFDDVVISYGGRIGEELIMGPDFVDSGAIEDICHATETAKLMVFHLGMGDGLPPLFYGETDYQGRKVSYQFSEATRQKVDEAIMKLAERAHKTAKATLEHYRDKHQALTDALVKHGKLSGKQIYKITGIDPDNPPGFVDPQALATETVAKPDTPQPTENTV